MNEESLARRRDRTHAIVEGALLGDIAIVFLMMRAYLPVPVVRTVLWTFAAVPLVMLAQRRGIRLAILAGIASYILFSALVGPLLALAAVDVAVAGILVGIGRRTGLHAGLNTLWTGTVFAIVDRVIPTVITVIVFRYPVKTLIKAAKNFVRLVFNFMLWVMHQFGASASTVHRITEWQTWSAAHWQVMWIGVNVLYGILIMYLVVIVSEIVLKQIPQQTLARQRAA